MDESAGGEVRSSNRYPGIDLTGVMRLPGDLSFDPAVTSQNHQQAFALAVEVSKATAAAGGRALIVGGGARDEALRRLGTTHEPKDVDLEVYGLSLDELWTLLQRFGTVNVVGKSFGVMKLGGLDVSIPRRETKHGPGHRGFAIETDPWLPFREAARRRDFTVNALAFDPLTGELLDPWGGLDDLHSGILRACDPSTFADDPLRVLRAAQLAARLGFAVEAETAALCRMLDLRDLSPERVGEEWVKLLTKSPGPSVGLAAMRELGVTAQLHPQLHALSDTPQDPVHHPEGNVWMHTCLVVDAAAEDLRDAPRDTQMVVVLAALCHDLGKPATTVVQDGRIQSPGHAAVGAGMARDLLSDLRIPQDTVDRVVPLVREHMYPGLSREVGDASVRRLSLRLQPATIQELVMLGRADRQGRGTVKISSSFGEDLLRQAQRLDIISTTPAPLVRGRDLLDVGWAPGPRLGKMLRLLYEAQLVGTFATTDEGLEFMRRLPISIPEDDRRPSKPSLA